MKSRFIFPVYHKDCEFCKNRFQCMTSRINVNITWRTRVFYESIYIPFNINSNCFETDYAGDIRIANSKVGSRITFE